MKHVFNSNLCLIIGYNNGFSVISIQSPLAYEEIFSFAGPAVHMAKVCTDLVRVLSFFFLIFNEYKDVTKTITN